MRSIRRPLPRNSASALRTRAVARLSFHGKRVGSLLRELLHDVFARGDGRVLSRLLGGRAGGDAFDYRILIGVMEKCG